MRILVAEDNPAGRELMRDLLELEGHTVDIAADGAEALDIARQTRPDVVLMDVHLPVLGGIEAIRLMQQDLAMRSIPVIALTAGVTEAEFQRAAEAGCVGHMIKPIDIRKLCGLISKQSQVDRLQETA